jgi:hypothetical protein
MDRKNIKNLLDFAINKLNISKDILEYEFKKEQNTKNNSPKFRKKKYSCDEDFFLKDNELSFYWAGFIAADGCSFKKKFSEHFLLSIGLSEKDKNHLLKFKDHIQYTGPLRESTTKHSLTNPNWKDCKKNTISINSNKICNDLKRFNVVQRKTKIYTFPEWLKNHPLVHHYMRGYNDGDGSFFYDKPRDRICFELRGTKEFLEVYLEILKNHIKCKATVTTPDSTSKIKLSGKNMMPSLVDFLYKDASIFLERKYDIAKLAKDIKIERKR